MAEPNYIIKVTRKEINAISDALQTAHALATEQAGLVSRTLLEANNRFQLLSAEEKAQRIQDTNVLDQLLRRIG